MSRISSLRLLAPLVFLAGSTMATAEEFVLTLDIPVGIGTSTYLANQTVLRESGSYSLDFDGSGNGMDPSVNINALALLEDGRFLFSTDAPFESRGVHYEARDVVLFDQGLYSLHVSGADLGLSRGANIDALARDSHGGLILSLENPEIVGGLSVGPSDLMFHEGSLFTLVLASDLRLPDDTNVVGLEHVDDGELFMMFDIPTKIGGSTYLPGEIARLDGVFNDLFFSDAALPRGSVGSGFSFPGSPGEAPELVAAKIGADVDLAWQPSCSGLATDYAIYEGSIGSWYSHEQVQCSTGGQTSAAVTPNPGDRYFLVVPRSEVFEGSYGIDSAGLERPQSPIACVELLRAAACP